ncbi:hypothetical protein LCGC14_2586720, partial [marine sediment metagenome]
LMVVGQLSLGLGSIIIFFGWIGTAIKFVGGFLMGLSGVAMIAIAIIIAIVIGMWVAWKENFMNMKQFVLNIWNSLKLAFGGLFDYFGGIVDFFMAIFRGDWRGAVEAVIRILSGLGRFFLGIFLALANIIVVIGIGIIRVFKFVVDKIVGFFKWLYEKIVGGSIIPDMIKAIIAWFWKLPKSVFDMFKSIVAGMWDVGKDIIQKMADGIKSMGRKVIDSILGLFPSWMRSGIESSGKIMINIVKNVTEKIKKAVSGGRKNDFIQRSGQAPISINPRDTLVGFKGSPPNLGGVPNITQENNYYGFTMEDLKRELDDRDRRLVDDLKRMVPP